MFVDHLLSSIPPVPPLENPQQIGHRSVLLDQLFDRTEAMREVTADPLTPPSECDVAAACQQLKCENTLGNRAKGRDHSESRQVLNREVNPEQEFLPRCQST